MKVREVFDRLLCEDTKTSCDASGIKAYAEQMLRDYSGVLEKDILEGSEGIYLRRLNFQWMPDGESKAKRQGVDKGMDVARSDMTKIQGTA